MGKMLLKLISKRYLVKAGGTSVSIFCKSIC